MVCDLSFCARVPVRLMRWTGLWPDKYAYRAHYQKRAVF